MKHHDHVLSYYIFSNFTPTYLNMQIYTYIIQSQLVTTKKSIKKTDFLKMEIS